MEACPDGRTMTLAPIRPRPSFESVTVPVSVAVWENAGDTAADDTSTSRQSLVSAFMAVTVK
jgi:hypothetical protein